MPVNPANPVKNRKVVVKPAVSVPVAASGHNTNSTQLKSAGGSNVSHRQSMELDAETIDFGGLDADEGDEENEDEAEGVRPGSNKDGDKKAPPRPKKSDFKGTIEGLVIDRAVEFIETALIGNPCPTSDEYELMVHQGWEVGVDFYDKSSKAVTLTERTNKVIKSLVSSFRTRGRRRVVEILASYFGLDVSPTQSREDVKRAAASLLPIRFHQDPAAKSKKAGHYRSPFVARAISALFYFGPKPPALRSGAEMEPMEEVTIAYACAVSEEILERYRKDGYIKTEQKAPKGQGQPRNRKKAAAVDKEIVPRAMQDELRDLMNVHLQSLEEFQLSMPRTYKSWKYGLHAECLKWAGRATLGTDKPKEDISPEQLAAVLSKTKARLPAVKPRHLDSKAQPPPKSRPQPRARPPPPVGPSSLEGILEEPNSNSGSDSDLSSPSTWLDNNRQVSRDHLGAEEDIEMSDGSGTGTWVRKKVAKSVHWKVVDSDSELEEAGEGAADQMSGDGGDVRGGEVCGDDEGEATGTGGLGGEEPEGEPGEELEGETKESAIRAVSETAETSNHATASIGNYNRGSDAPPSSPLSSPKPAPKTRRSSRVPKIAASKSGSVGETSKMDVALGKLREQRTGKKQRVEELRAIDGGVKRVQDEELGVAADGKVAKTKVTAKKGKAARK
ncbi:hypothetical protein RhiJN_01393 [Ceratobasidium sp. AG-Ba]|nr:hypothetical protein RhiJN_01393 [Ceratobasidium sp. AG-Ba]